MSMCPVYRNGECGMGGGKCTWDPNNHSSCNVPHPGQYEAKTTKSSGCFIATAALGSRCCTELTTLYRWRDDVLLQSFLGRLFVRVYYCVSPTIAKGIEHSPLARHLVSTWVIRPWCTFVNRLWPDQQTGQDN
jgi:hypothetical protein